MFVRAIVVICFLFSLPLAGSLLLFHFSNVFVIRVYAVNFSVILAIDVHRASERKIDENQMKIKQYGHFGGENSDHSDICKFQNINTYYP